jgi:hypothetical protein
MKGALYIEDSGNSKLAGSFKIDTTYVSIKGSCSNTCPLKQNKSCYAMGSFVGLTVRRLDKRARQDSPLQLARSEARCIDESYNGGKVPWGRDLRIHTSGDSRTWAGTRIINQAVGRWKKRGGGDAFTYTHSWAHVSRQEWSNVSVLASIESVEQVAAVRAQGFAPALVVSEHKDSRAYKLENCETTFIPCPAQTKPGGKEIGCADCRLCMKADWLYATNRGISFAAHGIRRNDLKRRLTVIQ